MDRAGHTRRAFIALAGSLLTSVAVRANANRPNRIGWLSGTRAADSSLFLAAFVDGLRSLGFVEGRNYSLDAHWGNDSPQATEAAASALVASGPRVIVTQGPVVRTVRQLTSSIPVVFGFSGDPVEAGLVRSLAHPGANLTGISFLTIELVGKRVELLKEALPHAKRIAVLALPQHPGDRAERRAANTAAAAVGLSTEYFEARNGSEIPEVLEAIARSRCDAAMMFPIQFIISNRELIAAWAIRHRIPTISGWGQFADGGNLMTYGPNLEHTFARLAAYVDRILQGTRPAELPVEQPSRVELVVNLRTARLLGITVAPSVLLRADRVIE